MENEAFNILKDYNNLESFGYLVLFLYCMGGGYVAAITAGVLSSIGKLDLTTSIFLSIIGNIIGSSLFAIIARTQKHEIIKIFNKHRRKLAYLQIMLKKYDLILFFISKYLHGIRTFVPLAVGISKYRITKFLLINVIATIIWGVSLVFLGFYASGFFLDVIKVLLQHPYLFPIAFIILAAIVALFVYVRKRIKERFVIPKS